MLNYNLSVKGIGGKLDCKEKTLVSGWRIPHHHAYQFNSLIFIRTYWEISTWIPHRIVRVVVVVNPAGNDVQRNVPELDLVFEGERKDTRGHGLEKEGQAGSDSTNFWRYCRLWRSKIGKFMKQTVKKKKKVQNLWGSKIETFLFCTGILSPTITKKKHKKHTFARNLEQWCTMTSKSTSEKIATSSVLLTTCLVTAMTWGDQIWILGGGGKI